MKLISIVILILLSGVILSCTSNETKSSKQSEDDGKNIFFSINDSRIRNTEAKISKHFTLNEDKFLTIPLILLTALVHKTAITRPNNQYTGKWWAQRMISFIDICHTITVSVLQPVK